MRLLMLVVVSIGLIISTYAQSDLPREEEYPVYEDEIENDDTLSSLRDSDTESTAHGLKEIPAAESREDDSEGTEDEDINLCSSPPHIEFAKRNRKKKPPYVIGAELTYSCDLGYSADGASHTSRCVQSPDGGKPTWTDPQIVCIPRSCGEPGYVANAHRTGSRFTFPNNVSFECDIGYVLRGSSIRYCQVNGRWSGSLPSCEEVFCNHPEHPENGRVRFTSLEYKSKLKYDCDSGYLLRNHQEARVCMENGSWSGPEPTCQEAQCEVPVAPEHGFVDIAGKPRIGSIALYSCEAGRRLVGSGTSKCLDTGEWMFDTPKCVDPCNVPNVPNGLIGRLEKRRNNRDSFNQLAIGTSIENRDELVLRCSDGYEPLGKNEFEIKLECRRGIWKNEPFCQPAKCRGEPPATKNGKTRSIGREHGQYVVYDCVPGTKKTKYGNVTCHFGQWRGVTPICADDRCYVSEITFPGLVKDGKNVYFSGESFTPVCEKGYDLVDPPNMFRCEIGKWKIGKIPPCVAASCLSDPPSIQNGRIKSYTGMHSSLVEYECEEGYIFQGSRPVQCLFGEWTNEAPVCKDSSCYFEDLNHKSGMITPPKNPVSSGETINVRCASGFSPVNVKPICTRGKWQEFRSSPCQPNDCVVLEINNGVLSKKITVKKYLGLKTEVQLIEEDIGLRFKDGHSLFVSCLGHTTFQGKNLNDVPTVCTRGKWKPTPVCLPYRTKFEEEEETSEEVAQPDNSLKQITAPTAVAPRQALPATSSQEKALNPEETNKKNTVNDENCFCLYRGSNDLVAFAGKEQLQFGSKVKFNCTVKLFCKLFGFHRLIGPKEMKCENCRSWDLSEYPGCQAPQRGHTYLEFEPSFIVESGGIVTVDQGLSPQVRCYSVGIPQYPSWRSNIHNSLWNSYHDHVYLNGGNILSSTLVFKDIDSRNNGEYSCAIPGFEGQTFELQVRPLCRAFDKNGELVAHYDRGLKYESQVIFSCKDRKKKLDGPSELTCMSNGEWSGQPPKCGAPKCPELSESEGMRIVYSDGQNVRSTATFHCLSSRKRNGNVLINCLPNGEWSGKMPSCTHQSCPIDKMTEKLPNDVQPHLKGIDGDAVPHGFEVPLVCEGDLRLSPLLPLKCGENGQWEVPSVRCIQGCHFAETPSNLIIEPKRDFYRFGDIVDLSCGPGQVLTSKVEIVMCLSDGWSEEIPSCEDAMVTEPNLEQSTEKHDTE